MIEAPAPFPAEVAKIPRGAALRRGLRANPLLVVGAVASACIVVVALLAPLLAPFPGDAGTATHPFTVLHPPSAQHWFGTDNVGRDILSRVLYGARISPLIAFIVLLIAGAIGIPLGLAAGYFGGWLDEVIMRVTDIFLAFPPLLLALAFAAVLPATLTTVIIAIAISWWPWYVSLTASALSFLGLGPQDPIPDWGLMVSEGQAYFPTAWWVVTFPGIAILLTAFAFNLLGDGLRDLLDPKRTFL